MKFSKDQLVMNVKYGLPAAISTGLFMVEQGFCEDGAATVPSFISGQNVSVDYGSLNATTMVNRIVTLICAIIALGGIVTIGQGYGTYSSGHAEDNSATEAKGIRKMIAGIVAVAAPAVFAWILNAS